MTEVECVTQADVDAAVTTAEYLDHALALLGPNGELWGKGAYNVDGRRCLMSALLVLPGHQEARRILTDVIGELHPEFSRLDCSRRALCFNDSPTTTWPDVERVFEKAIVRAEETV